LNTTPCWSTSAKRGTTGNENPLTPSQ
jgi:hypothetical protein